MPLPKPNPNEKESEYVARCMEAQKDETLPQDEKLARCYSTFRGDTHGDVHPKPRRIAFDIRGLDQKILKDDDQELVMPAVIASEIVQQYGDGYAYKPADELRKMAETAQLVGAVPVKILEHPGAETNYLLLKHGDVYGRADNFQYVKNLLDPKTQRPCRKGVKADVHWVKSLVPSRIIDQIKQGTLHDVSIGFTFDSDLTPGDYEGTHYDYVQRDIFLDHIAAPIEKGRCPGPICGIGYDSSLKFGMDEAEIAKCPVCRHIATVGLQTASQRLFLKYGNEVLRVISGTDRPEKPAEYKDVPDSEFADPENYKYPIDCAHVMAAWSYINMDKNQGDYSSEKWATMKGRVRAAMKRCGHEMQDAEDILTVSKRIFEELNSRLQKSNRPSQEML